MKHLKLNRSLKYILPFRTDDLMRLGNKNDSGYVVSKKALFNTNLMISLGMSNNWTFENSFLELNSKNRVHIYDHSVGYISFFLTLLKSIKRFFYLKSNLDNIFRKIKVLIDYCKLINSNNINHFQIKISNKNYLNKKRLNEILKQVKNKKILLSIDIEGDEYIVLDDIFKFHRIIHLIVIEFHHINKKKMKFKKIIKKLKKFFDIIHIHGNNYTSFCKDNLPITLEITLRNKKIYRINKKELVKKFPIKQIDYPNNVNQDDLKFYY